jgi:hypothetical protein
VNQVNLMADFGVTVLVGFIDYIRKLAEVARAEGLFDRIDVRMIFGHLGTEDRAGVEAAWGGAKAFDWYGVGDTGSIAGKARSATASTSGKMLNIWSCSTSTAAHRLPRAKRGTWWSPACSRTTSRRASASTPRHHAGAERAGRDRLQTHRGV